jgi:glucose/arabinose dehydrogenase/plastocyanin
MLASIPVRALRPGVGSAMLLAGAGAALVGVGLGAVGAMRRDREELATGPGERPGGGDTVSNARIPETVTGVHAEGSVAPPKVEMQTIATDLGDLVQVTNAPGDETGLYLVDRSGTLLRRDTRSGKVETVLDISAQVTAGGEQGLLSVAFHPRFESNRQLYLNFTDTDGDTRIVSARAGRDGKVDPSSLADVMVIDQPYGNHNGGQLQFGPDGMLYVGMGDGGSGGDPAGRAQDLGEHLGKVLRIDVDNPTDGKAYGIPVDNPFVDTAGAQPEIYATGVRNPWRFSFDRQTGDLWMGDVGQGAWEEIDYAPRGQARGANFGWDAREGAHPFDDTSLAPGTLVDPVLEYGRAEGASVIGGYVYRGDDLPALRGWYVYADAYKDTIRTLKVSDGEVVARRELPGGRAMTVSLGEGPDGELYGVTLGGELTKLVRPGGATGPGGVDDGGGSGPASVVEIGVRPGAMRFDQAEYRVPAGRVQLRLTNGEDMGHNIAIENRELGVNEHSGFVFDRGDVVELDLQLDPGTYRLQCDPHAGAGMVATLVVE